MAQARKSKTGVRRRSRGITGKVEERIMEHLHNAYADTVPFMTYAEVENIFREAGQYPEWSKVNRVLRNLEKKGLLVRSKGRIYLLHFREDNVFESNRTRHFLRQLAMLAHLIRKAAGEQKDRDTRHMLQYYLNHVKRAYNSLRWNAPEPIERSILAIENAGVNADWAELIGAKSVEDIIEEAELALKH